MALVPYRSAHELSREMDRLFATFFDTPTTAAAARSRPWTPAMDLVEGDDHYVLSADLPGLGEDDVRIEVQDRVLSVSGERRTSSEVREGGFHRIERASGAFRRTLTLPEGVDTDAITASFDRGVLEVRIPKPEQRRPRRVEINVGGAQPAIEGTATE